MEQYIGLDGHLIAHFIKRVKEMCLYGNIL